MPNRILKDSINESYGLSECSVFAIDLYKRLICYADDYGRFNADTMIMRARLFPREYESVTEEDIINGLVELVGVNKIQFYTPRIFNQCGKGGIYGAFPNWGKHQRLRESKIKCPDPDNTSINDWYLRRFVPIDMKARLLERDNFKCQVCGKFVTTCRDAKRFAKLGSGLYHIDHIVPVLQGGRASMENLRITCPECNLKRHKKFSFQEILAETLKQMPAETCGDSPQFAATCRYACAGAESESESESELESESKSEGSKRPRTRFVPPTLEEVEDYVFERNSPVDPHKFWEYFNAGDWKDAKGNPVRNWKQKLLTWEKYDAPKQTAQKMTFADMWREEMQREQS